jgi:hypothetical protein
MSKPFKFEAFKKPALWKGRYNRIPGKEPAFKVKLNGTVLAKWQPEEDEWLTSEFEDSSAVRRLAKAINDAKATHAGSGGGSFQINEFGQVICPIVGASDRYWVGNIEGVPRLIDLRDDEVFKLRLPASTEPGTPWDRPYIGMKFNLDYNDSIYFKQDDGDVSQKIRLQKENTGLIRRLREVRGSGNTIRFIVNLHGNVITKVEPGGQPVFVGKIDYKQWFPREQ